jgi:uncharacterized membrane protein (DUF373 family)
MREVAASVSCELPQATQGEGSMEAGPLNDRYAAFKANWLTLSVYQRFQQVIALVITWLIAFIIVVATWELTKEVVILIGRGVLDPLDYTAFQLIFGKIMIVLIALEFKHSILRVVMQRESIVQVRTVVLIALLAISRKFIILDAEASPVHMLSLAAVAVALGITYWLTQERDKTAPAGG